jgi:hypothetical protein
MFNSALDGQAWTVSPFNSLIPVKKFSSLVPGLLSLKAILSYQSNIFLGEILNILDKKNLRTQNDIKK